MLPDELEEVLTKDHNAFSHLIARQAFTPQCAPTRSSNTQPPLKLRDRVQLVGPEHAHKEFGRRLLVGLRWFWSGHGKGVAVGLCRQNRGLFTAT